jgi:pimeloyl-ACP methyl ester carboxylesterase
MRGIAFTPPPTPGPVTATANGGTFDATLHQIKINQGTIIGEITITGTPINSSFVDNPVIGTGTGNGTVTMIPGASSPGQRTMQVTFEMPVDFTNNLDLDGTPVSVRVQGTIRANTSVVIVTQPQGQTAQAGNNVTFTVTASGTAPLNYQWRRDGVNISGATSSSLIRGPVSAADSAGYSVLVWNSVGSVVSDTAHLAVLTEGANGNQPVKISSALTPTKPVGVDSLIVVTHGWLKKYWDPQVLPEWVNDMAEAITIRVPSNWRVASVDWASDAWTVLPTAALGNGKIKGGLFGQQIAAQSWQHVHLIGHSAGAEFVEAAAEKIKQLSPGTVVHSTFLDPYLGLFSRVGAERYGTSADWADCYFSQDVKTGRDTEGPLSNAYSADVTWVDPDKQISPRYCAGSNPQLFNEVCGQVATSSHGYPHDFYFASIFATNPACASGYGFAMSKEGGGWNNRGNYPVGQDSTNLCGPTSVIQSAFPLNLNQPFQINLLPYATSGAGVNLFGGSGFNLSGGSSQLAPQANRESDGPIILNDGPTDNGGGPVLFSSTLLLPERTGQRV